MEERSMEGITVACIQNRMSIPATREEFEAEARRYLRQAQSKAAQITIFPELSGVMLAPPLISGFKLGFVKRADQAKQPSAGFLSRGLGSVSQAAAGALGGGFRGSVSRLLRKNSDALRDLYFDVFGSLAREFGTAIIGGSLYLYDTETDSLRNRAYMIDADGEVLGFQDKFNIASDEEDLASPGSDLRAFQTRFGRLGLLIGRDIVYPELARLLTIQGVDLIVGIAASPGTAQARVLRSALALRAEENQVFTAACFLLGPNYLGKDSREEYFGQSAIMAPISLTERGDGLLVQAGTERSESMIAANLSIEALHDLHQTSRFRPRQEMNLGNLGPVLADLYQQGLTIEQAIERAIAGPAEPEPRPILFEPVSPSEPMPASQQEVAEPSSAAGLEPFSPSSIDEVEED
jgi:predicted amidohydrolase